MDTKEFILRSKKVHGDKYDYSKSVYVNPRTDIIVTCKKHGDFLTRPYNHMGGAGCRKCADELNSLKYRKNKDEFIKKAKSIPGDKYDYSKVEYVNWKTKVIIICPVHGEFTQTPNSHLNGNGCPKCGVKKRSDKAKYTTEEFVELAKKVHGDKYDYSQSEYVNTSEKVLIKCNKCGRTFLQAPENHLQNKGCPYCACQLSKAENEIYDELSPYFTDIIQRDRNILDGDELDIYIPSKHIAIEYNGLRWHSEEFGKDSLYHLNKLNRCNEKGVHLIHVFEDEWLSNKKLVIDKIKYILGVKQFCKKIYARKCQINEIDKDDAYIFLNANHIQGYSRSTLYLGCFYDNELISVMSFNKYRDNKWELTRFSSKNDYLCVGCAGKLLKFFIKKYMPLEIKSFADRRWTLNKDNNLYTKLGFKLDRILKPDYRYIVKNQRLHKFGFRKKILHKKYNLPLSMTEKQMTDKMGIYRIWDCGLFKYVWKKNEQP